MSKSTVPTGQGKRKANGGSFKKGHDPRRHRLTTEERRRGFLTLVRIARGAAVSKKARQAAFVLDRIGAALWCRGAGVSEPSYEDVPF